MKKHLLKLLLMLAAFAAGVSVSLLVRRTTQETPLPTKDEYAANSVDNHAEQDRAEEGMLRVLLQNRSWSWGDPTHMRQVIIALRIAEHDASPEAASGIAFLLALVGEDYQINKSKLLDELTACRKRPYPEASNCAYLIGGYLMDLGRRGDASVIPPLFGVTDMADRAFSESLGDFYSDALMQYPTEFLTSLKLYSPNEQQKFCELAGLMDGSGMSDEQYREAKRLLNRTFSSHDSSLAPLAKKCLNSIKHVRATRAD